MSDLSIMAVVPTSLADHLVMMIDKAMPRGLTIEEIEILLLADDFDGDVAEALISLSASPHRPRLVYRSRRDQEETPMFRLPLAQVYHDENASDAAVLEELLRWTEEGDEGYDSSDLADYFRVPHHVMISSLDRLRRMGCARHDQTRRGWWVGVRGGSA